MNQYNKLGKSNHERISKNRQVALGSPHLQDAQHCSRCLQEWSCDGGRRKQKAILYHQAWRCGEREEGSYHLFFEVLDCIEQRVGAKMLFGVYKNVTDPKQYELLEMSRISGFVDRARGTGRPTKKERRALDAFVDPALFGFEDEDWDEEDQ